MIVLRVILATSPVRSMMPPPAWLEALSLIVFSVISPPARAARLPELLSK